MLSYHVLSRLVYVGYIGVALSRQRQTQYYTTRWGVEHGFRRFRRVAAVVMNNDAVSFVLLCWVTRNTLPGGMRASLALWGVLLVLVGVGVKLWARATLGARAYYWYDFFGTAPAAPTMRGPYRFFRNPMYTLGYVQTYGLALLTASAFGLCAGLFDQAAILAFHGWVERPHVQKMGPRGTLA